MPKDVEVGDPVEVFLYKDSSDRLIATTQEPKITLDKLAVLKVADTGRIGAFLDWGLEKDLLLPFKGADCESEKMVMKFWLHFTWTSPEDFVQR